MVFQEVNLSDNVVNHLSFIYGFNSLTIWIQKSYTSFLVFKLTSLSLESGLHNSSPPLIPNLRLYNMFWFFFFSVFRIKMKKNEWMILMMSVALVYCTDPCPMKQTCHECIQDPNCAWCAQADVLPWASTVYTVVLYLCKILHTERLQKLLYTDLNEKTKIDYPIFIIKPLLTIAEYLQKC